MLLARATTKTGNDLLLIGLSTDNLRRLSHGQPIDITTYTSFDEAEPLHIVIFHGATEDAMQQQLAPLIGRDTEMHMQGNGGSHAR